MTVAEFKAMVTANGGEDAVLCITFDGGPAAKFTKVPFTFANNLDETHAMLTFIEYDLGDRPYKVARTLDTFFGITFTVAPYTREKYDALSLR